MSKIDEIADRVNALSRRFDAMCDRRNDGATASTFISYLKENEGKIPKSVFSAAKREGQQRLKERWQAGRAEGPLDFGDLINKLENSIGGK
jgi:hypothetical protein